MIIPLFLFAKYNLLKTGVSIAFIFLLFCLTHCAKRGTPTGGPLDSIPPVLVNASPKQNTTFFDENKIQLTFDEYITLKNINKQLIVSPPLERDQYSVSPQTGAAKKITIELLDSLLANTTYTFNFGNSIADFNETNPYPFFSYTFSTGSVIDSLGLRGHITDALENETKRFISIQMYPVDSVLPDSTIYTQKPFYAASSLDTTVFQMKNLKPGRYEIIALQDVSGNYFYDQGIDKIGFRDEPITLPQDSIIDFRLFKEPAPFAWTRPFFINERHIGIGFYGNPEGQTFEQIAPVTNSFEALITRDRETDTLHYWFKGGANLDSLKFRYIQKDTLATTTVSFNNPVKDSLVITKIAGTTLSLADVFKLRASLPIVAMDSTLVSVQNIDSLAIPFQMVLDENYDRIALDFDLEPNDTYRIELLPNALRDFWGQSHDTLRFKAATKKPEDLGTIYLKLDYSYETPFILQLLKKDRVVREYTTRLESEVYDFKYLSPGKYTFRFIKDKNGNGKWDPGNYRNKIQPEEVIYFLSDLEIRANWDLNESFQVQ